MNSPTALLQTNLNLPGKRQGKVRDVYDAGVMHGYSALAIVATDRLSAFDVVLPTGIPDKGIILTQLSNFWFHLVGKALAPNLQTHVISTEPQDLPSLDFLECETIRGRIVFGRKTSVVPIECVVRGYLAGSGWAEYKSNQSVCGVALPPGLRQCEKLPHPIFTPAIKNAVGHDENVSFDRAAELVNHDLLSQLRDHSLAIYKLASDYAADRGIIIADTKFEFGIPFDSDTSAPILIDEILTPDSSRFWPADQYEPGHDQPSFDKQFVRNYLQDLVDRGLWDKTAPGPQIPDNVIEGTRQRYLEAYRLLVGRDLE